MSIANQRRDRLREHCSQWCNELQNGDRAQLRRAADTPTLASNEAVFQLERRLRSFVASTPSAEHITWLAALLADVRIGEVNTPLPRPLAERAGANSDGKSGPDDKPKLSRTRLARLLKADSAKLRLRGFRQLLQMCDRQADLGELAELFLFWHEPKVQWAFARQYFNPAAQMAREEFVES